MQIRGTADRQLGGQKPPAPDDYSIGARQPVWRSFGLASRARTGHRSARLGLQPQPTSHVSRAGHPPCERCHLS